MKKVRITIELPNSAVKLLHMSLLIKFPKLDQLDRSIDISDLVSLLVCMEAMGMTEEQIHENIPSIWQGADNPALIHEERRVYEDGKQISPKI
jgi:hypothetical protein